MTWFVNGIESIGLAGLLGLLVGLVVGLCCQTVVYRSAWFFFESHLETSFRDLTRAHRALCTFLKIVFSTTQATCPLRHLPYRFFSVLAPVS